MTESDRDQVNALSSRNPPSALDGGIEEIDSPKADPGGPRFSPEEHRAKTTKLLMVLSFTALCLLFAAHFTAILLLAHDKPNAVDEITRVFGTWVPIFSTLVGSAATYYFTRERK
jgi:hypothetical protein